MLEGHLTRVISPSILVYEEYKAGDPKQVISSSAGIDLAASIWRDQALERSKVD